MINISSVSKLLKPTLTSKVSMPSRQIYVVDVPEVKDFSANFKYNFFVPDEMTTPGGNVPKNILSRQSDSVDTEFMQYAAFRAPRFVAFKFTPPVLAHPGNTVSDTDAKNNAVKVQRHPTLIQDNLDKVLYEDRFASQDFTMIHFLDAAIDDKAYLLVSGTFDQVMLQSSPPKGMYANVQFATSMLAKNLRTKLLGDAMHSSKGTKKTSGTTFNTNQNKNTAGNKSGGRLSWMAPGNRNTPTPTQVTTSKFERLKKVGVNAQFNSRFLYSIIHKSVSDPVSPYASDLAPLLSTAKSTSLKATKNASSKLSENDYKTVIPYVNLKVNKAAHNSDKNTMDIVGFIIDKYEVTEKGLRQLPSLIVESPVATMTIDFNVKYGVTYVYAIRTIAQLFIPALDVDTNELAMLQILVSSKPSTKVHVPAVENTAPPPPADLNFTWDYELNKLLIHWCFPTNSQRDVKKFQVFRRRNISEPFQLIKMYDFDDSVIRRPNYEDPDPQLVVDLKSPVTFYVDDDFMRPDVAENGNVSNPRFIYAVACIDAHGLTSNYSAQFEVWFDVFKNSIQKKLISHSGAPKPYPNLYLESDTFVDTFRVSGPHSKRLRVFFNPEQYLLHDDQDRYIKIISTLQDGGGSYAIQLLNLDNQKDQIVKITLDDQRNTYAMSTTSFSFTPMNKTANK